MSTGPLDTETPRLVADIGGTNARFGLYVNGDVHAERVLACADYPTVVAAIEAYLSLVNITAPGQRPVEAAMAIAGPITGDLIRMTNHVWQFSVTETCRQLGWSRGIALNDFTALAMAVRHLPANELEQVGTGRPVADAAIAVIGPGTGLGVSGLLPSGLHYLALQGEGGHSTVPMATEREIAALQVLHRRFSHVSAERVISGPGLVNLYDALCVVDGVPSEAPTPADVTRRALDGSCRVCRETVSMFCGLLGVVAGNLALTLGALGGVYIGGGIVPRLGRFFASSPFRDRFEDKGRYTEYLSGIPSYVIHTSKPAFVGLMRAFVEPGPRYEVRL
jgi:glucokinase